MRSNDSGGSTAGTLASNHPSTPPRSIPSRGASSAIRPRSICSARARAERADGRHGRLLVDFGGVLTTNMWEGFDEFCRAEGIAPGGVLSLFKHEPKALADLRLLETGELEPEEFERRFAPRLGIERADGLIARMFAAVRPEERLIDAVRAAREAGVRTGLISNSWGTAIDPDALGSLFDVAIISGEVGLHKPQAAPDLPARGGSARGRAAHVRVRRRPARERARRRAGGDDGDPPP